MTRKRIIDSNKQLAENMEGSEKVFCVIAKYVLEAIIQDKCMMLPLGLLPYSEKHQIDTSSNSESLDTLSKTSKDSFESLQRDLQATTTDHLTLKQDQSINTSNSCTFHHLMLLNNKAITKPVQYMNSDGIFSSPLVAKGKSQLRLYRYFLAQSRCSTTKKKVCTSFYVTTVNTPRKVHFLEFIHAFLQYCDYMNVICIHINRRKCFLRLRKYIVRVRNQHHRSDVIHPEEILCLGLDFPFPLSSKENELYPERLYGSTWTTIASRMAHRTLSTIIKS